MTIREDPMSLAWACAHYSQRIERLFAALDLELPALAAVKSAVDAREWEQACEALLAYYRTCGSGQWLRHAAVTPSDAIVSAVEKMTEDIFPVPGGEAQIPRLPSGGLDWGYIPPRNGGADWVYGINRHDYMTEMLAAYFATGNRKYARCLNRHLHDWCSSVICPDPPETHEGVCPWGTILEAGHRSKVWPSVFYGLQREDAFAPATRILLMSQALDHAIYLHTYHTHGSNWVITEMSGLLSIACAWPELREATGWRELALQLAQDELQGQVYPDGVQKELSSNYQSAVLWHMGFFVATMRGAGIPESPALTSLLERMWNYLAYSLGPNGLAPHNSDSDRGDLTGQSVIDVLQVTKPLLDAAETYHRPDWTYIATNGARGEAPKGLPSVLFPWAGQVITRSGWEANAQWGFFDIGPWGILHQHFDALHLSVTANGRDLLVDSGRYTYENYWGEAGTWRSYFIGSAAHNVILVDGLGQVNGPTVTEQAIGEPQVALTPTYDYAQGSYASGFADVATAAARHKAVLWRQDLPNEGVDWDVTHSRGVLYLHGVGWIVVDRIATDRPRHIMPLWHFHPSCTVTREGQSVVTVDEGVGNLRIQPIGAIEWDIAFVSGREGPDFQGWYSSGMDVKVPNTCACYTANIPRTSTFAWLLLPANGAVPVAEVTILPTPESAMHLLLDLPGRPRIEAVVCLDDNMPVRLTNGEAVTGHCGVRTGCS